ncbi:hypothetical protein LOK49_LG07G00184 [Camellia lanceoleosa]|uniref:Uncharacterized protein n=1 Tax=Camellia lanceoleosa TaxID=1840588 RepID=A0ACC0H2X7_9ERIC|nr:hypothetical protein LOK49_LG07G00184 [Camellia lanceoleosa]
MEHYDEEDDGVELIGTRIRDAYYPSNDMDPYLKDQNDDDSEEVEDMTITAEDAVIVCARNEDDVSHLEACFNHDLMYYICYSLPETTILSGAAIPILSQSQDDELG